MWKIRKIVSKGDYNYAVVPEHPNSTKNGYVLEHRVVMENHLCRLLEKDEVVHHKDNNKKNNAIENLELMNNREHSRLHGTKGISFRTITCQECGAIFQREVRQIHGGNNFCTRSCNGKFQRREQLSRQ